MSEPDSELGAVLRKAHSIAVVGVKDLENAKNEAHEDAYTSPSCGFDQYMDNHFDLTQYEVPVDTITDLLTEVGNKWHCNRVGFGSIDVYAVEPTGDAIQLDGYLTDAGTSTMMTYGGYNTTNVLFHLCSEGKCITKAAPVSHLEPGDAFVWDSRTLRECSSGLPRPSRCGRLTQTVAAARRCMQGCRRRWL